MFDLLGGVINDSLEDEVEVLRGGIAAGLNQVEERLECAGGLVGLRAVSEHHDGAVRRYEPDAKTLLDCAQVAIAAAHDVRHVAGRNQDGGCRLAVGRLWSRRALLVQLALPVQALQARPGCGMTERRKPGPMRGHPDLWTCPRWPVQRVQICYSRVYQGAGEVNRKRGLMLREDTIRGARAEEGRMWL